jgi:hypothetical protein
MPTKTKVQLRVPPKVQAFLRSVEPTDEDIAGLSALFGLRGAKLNTAMNDLRLQFSMGISLVASAATSPLPANQASGLKRVLKSTERLLVDLDMIGEIARWSVDADAVENRLKQWIPKVRDRITALTQESTAYRANVRRGVRTQLRGSDGGARSKGIAYAKAALRSGIIAVYDRRAKDRSDESRLQFERLVDAILQRSRLPTGRSVHG